MTHKVFGIGMNKTGTQSLAEALRLLGFRTMHKGGRGTSALVERAYRESRPLLSYLKPGFDAYVDVHAFRRLFPVLDAQYPGSKFIMSVRGVEAWLDSRERHVRANLDRAARGFYTSGWIVVDREAWLAERQEHEAFVARHFAHRPDDLLVLDICGGSEWEALAPFLGRPPPEAPFPWRNRDGTGTYRRAQKGLDIESIGLRALRRRIRPVLRRE